MSKATKIINVGPIRDGEILARGGAGTFEVINPATGQPIAREACCDEETTASIVESSARAFASADWQRLTPADRGKLLLKLADLVEQHAERLVQLELLDVGKPVTQLRSGELPLTADLIRFYAGAADKIEGLVKNTSGGYFSMMTYEPYGVVAGILPWNYPLVNAAMKVAPAVAAGNAIVLKPSVETPLTAVAFARLCSQAGMPPGIVNVVTGSGAGAGQALVAHPSVRKISFTGSTAVGQRIQKLAADQMKMVNLECGGKNAIIVFADADLERAAQATLLSAFVNAGQLCVSCSRLLVQKRVAARLLDLLKQKVKRIRVGDPRDSKTLVGPLITRSQYETALSYLKTARSEGCQIVCGGGKPNLPARLAGGFWLEPTILAHVKPGMKVHDEEIFGPVLGVTPFEDESEAVAIANSVDYGLSGSVWTSAGERALRMVKALDTGIVWVNTMLTGYPQIPVPPHKMSGTGVELGMEGLLTYCKRKSAVLSYDNNAPVGWGL
jgi:acyl-CoA reductase-like NAD-dependent aldehyde dehydrogenase